MTVSPLVGARRFETYVRWSGYVVVAIPAGTLLGTVRWADRLTTAPLAAWVVAVVLSLALVAGNILVTNWSLDTVLGRARRFRLGGVIAWLLVLTALVAVTFLVPLPALGLTVAAAIGSVAASYVPVLGKRRTLLLNAAAVVLAVPLVGVSEIPLLLAGVFMISAIVWICWSGAWTLRLLLELQSAHETRAELSLANERLRIARDLHDVFGRTLATIAVKTSLAAELVDRGHNDRAASEITEVRRLAEEAGTEVRHVVRGELRTTWDGEVSGARSLLESAGIRCTVTGDPVPEECAETLAWVVREGVTNLLRHSAATRVTLATADENGELFLTIANDGVGPADAAPSGEGAGLRSMSARIRALGGRLTVRRDEPWFTLEATIPLPKEGSA